MEEVVDDVRLKRRLTVDEYHVMAEAGILKQEDRVELIAGCIVEKSPIGPLHFHTVNRITQLLTLQAHSHAIVSVQNPVRLGPYSEPEPDLALLKRDLDTTRIAGAADVLLLIEVADSTLAHDRAVKLPLYAEAEIPEVWILALPEHTLEVYRQPHEGRYKQALFLSAGDTVTIEALPDVGDFAVADFLG